jgi:hypothetical protein
MKRIMQTQLPEELGRYRKKQNIHLIYKVPIGQIGANSRDILREVVVTQVLEIFVVQIKVLYEQGVS